MTNKGNSNSRPPKRYKWIAHLPVYFNDDERDAVLAYIADRTWDVPDVIAVLTQMEVGIKVSYDKTNDAYYCTLQPKASRSPYFGYTIGFSHAEVDRLFQIASYVVTELLEHEGVELPGDKVRPDW